MVFQKNLFDEVVITMSNDEAMMMLDIMIVGTVDKVVAVNYEKTVAFMGAVGAGIGSVVEDDAYRAFLDGEGM